MESDGTAPSGTHLVKGDNLKPRSISMILRVSEGVGRGTRSPLTTDDVFAPRFIPLIPCLSHQAIHGLTSRGWFDTSIAHAIHPWARSLFLMKRVATYPDARTFCGIAVLERFEGYSVKPSHGIFFLCHRPIDKQIGIGSTRTPLLLPLFGMTPVLISVVFKVNGLQ